jgi:hypothetical protein
MKTLRCILLVLALTALAAGTGCGSSSSQPPLTKSQMIKKGDAICRKVDKKQELGVAAYEKNHPSANLLSVKLEETMVVKVGLPPILVAAEELERLEPPAGDEKKIAEMISAVRKGVAQGEKEPQSVNELTANPFSASDRLARAYGFEDCAEIL